jgi:hypothetical protein
MPENLYELVVTIRGACESSDVHILRSVWNETDYCFGVCRVSIGSHIRNLEVAVETFDVVLMF